MVGKLLRQPVGKASAHHQTLQFSGLTVARQQPRGTWPSVRKTAARLLGAPSSFSAPAIWEGNTSGHVLGRESLHRPLTHLLGRAPAGCTHLLSLLSSAKERIVAALRQKIGVSLLRHFFLLRRRQQLEGVRGSGTSRTCRCVAVMVSPISGKAPARHVGDEGFRTLEMLLCSKALACSFATR